MGQRQAFISFDDAFREQMSRAPFPYLVCFRATLKAPDDRGLPVDDEFASLNAVEDCLTADIAGRRGIQVGRITTAGARYFYFYSSLDQDDADSLAQAVAARFSYELAVRHEWDAQHAAYMRELYPTDDDWQVIRDMRTEAALRKEGDTLTRTREIVHSAYFGSEPDRRRFVEAVQAQFELVEYIASAVKSQDSFGVKLTHMGLPDYSSMNRRTLLLRRAARAANGQYDGWETSVCVRTDI